MSIEDRFFDMDDEAFLKFRKFKNRKSRRALRQIKWKYTLEYYLLHTIRMETMANPYNLRILLCKTLIIIQAQVKIDFFVSEMIKFCFMEHCVRSITF